MLRVTVPKSTLEKLESFSMLCTPRSSLPSTLYFRSLILFIREIHIHIFGLCPLPLILMFSLSGLPADFLIASCNEYDSNVAHDHHQVLLRLQYISSSRTCVQDRCNWTHCAIIWALAAPIFDQCPPGLLTPFSPTLDRPIPGSPLPTLLAIAPCPYLIF